MPLIAVPTASSAQTCTAQQAVTCERLGTGNLCTAQPVPSYVWLPEQTLPPIAAAALYAERKIKERLHNGVRKP